MGRRWVVAGLTAWAALLLGGTGVARAECLYFPIPPATGAAGGGPGGGGVEDRGAGVGGE